MWRRREDRSDHIAPGALIDFCRRRSIPRWINGQHLDLIAEGVQRAFTLAAEERGINLMIFAPPRHGKTHTTCVMGPCWAIGQFRSLTIILASYGAKLAVDKAALARDIMMDVGPQEFGVSVHPDYSTKGDWRIEGFGGRMLAVGVEGPIVGQGANVGIIDDPYKTWKQANSSVIREAIYSWYKTVFSTRIEPGGSRIITHTRWHEDDLGGRLLREEGLVEEGGKWHVISLEARCDHPKEDPLGRKKGDALWPEKGWTKDVLDTEEKDKGIYAFSALYQQKPMPAKGTLFRRPWFRSCRVCSRKVVVAGKELEKTGFELDVRDEHAGDIHREWVSLDSCWAIMAADTALSEREESDFCAFGVGLVTPPVRGRPRLILRDVVHERIEGPDQVPTLVDLVKANRPAYIGIERATAGIHVIQEARRKGIPVWEVHADADKVVRAGTAASLYRAGDIFHVDGAPWLSDYEQELLHFPRAPHDDQADMIAYLARMVVDTQGMQAQVFVGGVNLKTKRQRETERKGNGKEGAPRPGSLESVYVGRKRA
jgi:predicted phage terminase large subunit-like protein